MNVLAASLIFENLFVKFQLLAGVMIDDCGWFFHGVFVLLIIDVSTFCFHGSKTSISKEKEGSS